jgi:glycosyltransferase involved in cell wall biosynthesis
VRATGAAPASYLRYTRAIANVAPDPTASTSAARRRDPAPRVALLLPTLSGGGAERVTLNLAIGFLARGYAVDVVVRHLVGDLVDQVPSGAERVDLRARRAPVTVAALARYLRRVRPQALLGALPHTNVLAVVAAGLAGYRGRLVLAEHNQLNPDGRLTPTQRILLTSMRATYPRADRIIAVSHGVKDSLATTAHIPPDHIEVIYNPVITPELQRATHTTPDHPYHHGPDPVILGIGRLTRQKNFPNLIRAFAQVLQRRPAKLLILGEGEERPTLTHLIHTLDLHDHIDLPGFVPNPHAHLKAAHLFALSSDWEGLPTVLIEALAAGTPIVSTDCPSGPREILDDGRHGQLVPTNDPTALAQAILHTLQHPPPPIDPNWLHQFTLDAATDHYARTLGLTDG